MEKFLIEQIAPLIKRHGLSFVLLCCAIYWQNNKMGVLESNVSQLQDKYELCLIQNSTISVKEAVFDIQETNNKIQTDLAELKKALK